ncbi:hypothetical protein [Vibrio campbellii]|uniref:hypothetical protein n=1 Tax=Vibrio campbellii TaxID=680 RepID=UPI0006822713|nr:hypothetical protein [Vibrio campbellii]AQM70882.1 hypothetical protein Vca1114GL_04464 [Vibrio campbellii]AUV88371.1 hypothetical protein C1N50_19655 [Vibrio campbellii]
MKRSLRPWIGLLLLSLTLYGVSVYVSEKKLLLSGRYTTTVQQYSADGGVWKERIEVDLNNENLESTVSIEGNGLEGVALFAVTGKINNSFNGEFEFSYTTEPIQTTKVLDGYQAASYSSLFLSGTSKNQLIYHDENLDVIARERNHLMLSRVW